MLLDRYVAAFEEYDIDRLTELLHEDAIQSMPPISLWLKGRDDLFAWWLGPGIGCKGSKLVPVGLVNGMPAWGQYKPDPTAVTNHGRSSSPRCQTAGSSS